MKQSMSATGSRVECSRWTAHASQERASKIKPGGHISIDGVTRRPWEPETSWSTPVED
jgi:hypothetical protein